MGALARTVKADNSSLNAAGHNTLKHQLGASWFKLHSNIQQRFDREPEVGERIVYTGTMRTIRRSSMGWLFAHLTKVIGNPLTPFAGSDIPMEVALYKKPGISGVHWQRTYMYPGKAPYVVTSIKRESEKGEMLDALAAGLA